MRFFIYTIAGSLAAIALFPVMKAAGSTLVKYFKKIDVASDELVKKEDKKDEENTENL